MQQKNTSKDDVINKLNAVAGKMFPVIYEVKTTTVTETSDDGTSTGRTVTYAEVLLPTEALMGSIKITVAEQCSMCVRITRNVTHMCAFIQEQIFRWEQWQTENFASSEMRHTNIFQN